MAKSKAGSSVGDKNRRLILQAAEQVFAQCGFGGASVQKIADTAGLPKTNVLYYFKSKQALYQSILSRILTLWNSRFDQATGQDDPAITLAEYITEKMQLSQTHPLLSRIFAMEIINGAPNLNDAFNEAHKAWMASRVDVIQQWIDAGKMHPVEPAFLLYNIWGSTQHYADFATQITHLQGQEMSQSDFDSATNTLINMVLKGCGLVVPKKYETPVLDRQ